MFADILPFFPHFPKEEDPVPYTFFVNEEEVVASLVSIVEKQKLQPEEVLQIVYQPQVRVSLDRFVHC
jgi:hypothetical protein